MKQRLKFDRNEQSSKNIANIIHTLAAQEDLDDGEIFNAILKNKVPDNLNKLPVSKVASKVDALKNFILKNRKRFTDDLLRAMLEEGNKGELMELRTFCLVRNFNYIKDQTMKEVDMLR